MRKVMDCREYPSEVGCTLVIIGEEDEVMGAAVQHAVAVHGEEDSQEFRDALRGMLKPEVAQPA
ncbi:uncharacterized protein DUF1059 [Streptomyces sp. 3211.6]|uniref:DUF1059 domain-containing protein n=1 Tax=Streptomyces TaxID=1883 RepID=UPI0009A4D53F|nr:MULTISPECIES: DUF1059 domain-containing protein [Streptomyces]RKT04470.1 uncharacterized protein DUF1059 [Streptomyces sp. 3211.6]RPF40354.1 uncharacterized protein DUF1059 [Streptomyces sp. Ag109_G2-6]